jgi:hypothetical protein
MRVYFGVLQNKNGDDSLEAFDFYLHHMLCLRRCDDAK